MDVDNLLNLERRTGVKNHDIDDFNRKVDEVNAAIKGMLEGTVKPEDVKIDGIETEEEKARAEAQRQERLAAQKIKNEQLRKERKQEEIKRWWAGAEIARPNLNKDKDSVIVELPEKDGESAISKSSRYSLDYSKWSEWKPTDAATLEEEAEKLKAEEDRKNKEFEANNAEFCKQFETDMKEREKNLKKKAESSDISRLKGNRYYKAKQYEKALEYYMEALKDSPYDTKTLTNIAQAHIKMKNNEDAIEFLNRTLYLEENHVKALSRKAFVCSEMGDFTAAMQLIEKVIALEPQNTELLALKREILSIEKEARDQKALEQTSSTTATAASTTPVAATVSTAVPEAIKTKSREFTFPGGVDALLQLFTEDSTNNGKSLNPEWLASVASSVLEIVGYLPDNEANKLSIRTAGVLTKSLDLLKLLLIDAGIDFSKAVTPGAMFDFKSSSHIAALSALLRLVALSINQQRTSKQLLLDSKVVSAVRQLLSFCTDVTSGDAECGVQSTLVSNLMLFLYECSWDDSFQKLQLVVLSDVTLVSTLTSVLNHLTRMKVDAGEVTLWSGRAVAQINQCVEMLQLLARHQKDKLTVTHINELTASVGSVLLLHFVMRKVCDLDQWNAAVFPSANQVIALLLDVSQVESMRVSFASTLAVDSVMRKSNSAVWKQYCRASTAGALVLSIEVADEFASNALAILMNASLESTDAVKAAIAKDSGASILLANLQLGDKERAKAESSVLVRKAGLLSRLAQIESVQSLLKLPVNYRMLCRRINLQMAQVAEKPAQWQLDERAHYIRCLASLTTISSECREIGLAEGFLASILDTFPIPRDDCGVVTAQTVTLMPLVPVSALVVGNAARCLLAYADDEKSAKQLYTNPALKGIEKLICAMASCSDIRVRRNIAILLAKGCRIDGVRARVSELRGLQMMVELQDKL